MSVNRYGDFIITDNGGIQLRVEGRWQCGYRAPGLWIYLSRWTAATAIITEYGKTGSTTITMSYETPAPVDVGSGIDRYEWLKLAMANGRCSTRQTRRSSRRNRSPSLCAFGHRRNVSEENRRDIVLDKTLPPTASHTPTPGKDGKVNINPGTDGICASSPSRGQMEAGCVCRDTPV